MAPIWGTFEQILGMLLLLGMVGLIITNSNGFVRVVSQTGQTFNTLFRSATFQE